MGIKNSIIVKFCVLFLLVLTTCFGHVKAATTPNTKTELQYPRVTLLGKIFELKYSTCTPKTDVCLNEYYRLKEKNFGWTELFTLHALKSSNNVAGYATMLYNSQKYSDLKYNSDKNEAIVSFLIPYQDEVLGGYYIEQNIFRIMLNPKGKGIVLLQYAIRLPFNNEEEKEKSFEKAKTIQTKVTNSLKSIEVPVLYDKLLQRW